MADDNNSPATKGDLADLKGELIEGMRDSQAAVVTSLYGFAQTAQDQFTGSDDLEASLKRRVAALESRILELERRLIFR